MLVATYDEELGMIRSVDTGFLTEQEIESHLATMESLAKQARARTGRVLHLVDATDAPVQSAAGSRACMREAARGRLKVDAWLQSFQPLAKAS